MSALRERIAAIIEHEEEESHGLGYNMDWAFDAADAILALPEIAAALERQVEERQQWSTFAYCSACGAGPKKVVSYGYPAPWTCQEGCTAIPTRCIDPLAERAAYVNPTNVRHMDTSPQGER